MPPHSRWAAYSLWLLVVVAGTSVVARQLYYQRGQNVVAVFEGWEQNPDGTSNFVFGYYNRNSEEVLDIPVGPDNSIEPGGPDQGQPTFFAPLRHQYMFRVKVPQDWGPTKRLVWTLTIRGKTERASAFLLPEWVMNDQTMAVNRQGGGGGQGDEPNNAPTITLGPDQTITLPDTATLSASVTDDGLPKPRPVRQGAEPGLARGQQLRVDWIQYRGPVGGKVTFTPASSPVTDGKALTTLHFTAPGRYVLLGRADDGNLATPATVTVTVSGK